MSTASDLALEELLLRLGAMSVADRDHVLARLGPDALRALEPMLARSGRKGYSGALSNLIDLATSQESPDVLAPGVVEFLRDLRAPTAVADHPRASRPTHAGPGLLRQAARMFSGRSA